MSTVNTNPKCNKWLKFSHNLKNKEENKQIVSIDLEKFSNKKIQNETYWYWFWVK